MKLKLTVLFIIVLCTAGFAGDSKVFMWSVRHGGAPVSYILGSIHVMKESSYPLKTRISTAFNSSSQLVVEADISDEKSYELSDFLMRNCTYRDNSDLKNKISKATYMRLDEYLSKRDTSIRQYLSFKPWFVAFRLTLEEVIKSGYNPELGIDRHFLVQARKKKMKVIQLEGVAEQVKVLNSMTEKQQELFLLYTLNDRSNSAKGLEMMTDLWTEGDVRGFENMVFKDIKNNREFMSVFDILVNQRNVNMTDKIVKALRPDKSSFIIVGAAHLVGRSGIINLLKQRGYELKQL